MTRSSSIAFLVTLALLFSSATPALGHPEHEQQARAEEAARQAQVAAAAGVTATDAMPAGMDHGSMHPSQEPRTFVSRLYRWLGAWHPAIVHFPIALFMVAAGLELAALALRRQVLRQGTRALVAVAAVSAVIAATMGWFAMGLPSGQDDVTHAWHRWLGTAVAVFGLLSWGAREFWERQPTRQRELLYASLLATTVAAILINAFLGGVLTHGAQHLAF